MTSIFEFLRGTSFSVPATRDLIVEAGATAIKSGTPMKKAANYIVPCVDGDIIEGTDFVGFLQTEVLADRTADMTVQVYIPLSGTEYVMNSATVIADQAAYDALIGTRTDVVLASGAYSVDATSVVATGGIEVVGLEVEKNPGKVAFRIRTSATDLA